MRKTLISVAAAALISVAAPVPAASAHDSVCGPIKNPGTRASCRLSYIRTRAKDRYEIRSGDPTGHHRGCITSYSPDHDGPHSFAGNFNCWYWNPGWFPKFHRCIGSVRIDAHTGKAIRWRDRYGRILTSKTTC
jgi:hypothetical protein